MGLFVHFVHFVQGFSFGRYEMIPPSCNFTSLTRNEYSM